MTNSVVDISPHRVPTPPYAEVHRQQRPRTITITIVAILFGALLIVGALLWSDLTRIGGQASSAEAAVATSEATTALESTPATETVLTASALTDVSDIASQVVDSIVVVEVTIDARGPFDATASGSGVIVSEDGVIVTNAHVVDDATSITVELTDGVTYNATVLAEDSTTDIAILDIDATGLRVIEIGSTGDLLVGDPVIAIGNPLALEGGPSVSTGIVSALNRVLEGTDTTLTGIIQTDAAITEGSSGGALLDANGELIGITTAVGVSSVGVEGIAFAVPVETVTAVLGEIGG